MNTKQIRQTLDLSQEKFAALLGVAPFTVRRWEAGKSNPSPLALEKLNKWGKLKRVGYKSETSFRLEKA